MKWKNVHVDGVPQHNEEVLVSINGVYHLTRFDAENYLFRSTEGMGLHFPVNSTAQIYWMRLERP